MLKRQQGMTMIGVLFVLALIGVIGQRTRVHEVMHGKRPLSLNMIRKLHEKFDVPAEVFQDYFGHIRGEDDGEPSVADVPAHHIFGVGVDPAAGGQHPGPGGCVRGSLGDDGGRVCHETLVVCSPMASAVNGAAVRADGGVIRSIA